MSVGIVDIRPKRSSREYPLDRLLAQSKERKKPLGALGEGDVDSAGGKTKTSQQ